MITPAKPPRQPKDLAELIEVPSGIVTRLPQAVADGIADILLDAAQRDIEAEQVESEATS